MTKDWIIKFIKNSNPVLDSLNIKKKCIWFIIIKEIKKVFSFNFSKIIK